MMVCSDSCSSAAMWAQEAAGQTEPCGELP